MDYIELGPVPLNEPCQQVGGKGYSEDKALLECHRYRRLLLKTFPHFQLNVQYKIQWTRHDFGRYCEVVLFYDEEDERCVDYAFYVENNQPEEWERDENGEVVYV